MAEEAVEVGGAEQARAEEAAEAVEPERVAAEVAGAEFDAVDLLGADFLHEVENPAQGGLVDAERLAVEGVEGRPLGELHEPPQELVLRGRPGPGGELERKGPSRPRGRAPTG